MARPSPRKAGPDGLRERLAGGWRRARDGVRTIRVGRLAVRACLAAAVIGTLVLLLTLSSGGMNRLGLKQLVDNAAGAAPASRPSGYLKR